MATNRRITKKQLQIHLGKQERYKNSGWDYNKIKQYIENLPDDKINDVIDTSQYQSYQGFVHKYSRTLLHVAVCKRMSKTIDSKKQLELIRLCLDKGANINIHLVELYANLEPPVINILNVVSNIEIAHFLINKGTDISHKIYTENPEDVEPFYDNIQELVCGCVIYDENYELAKLYLEAKLKQN